MIVHSHIRTLACAAAALSLTAGAMAGTDAKEAKTVIEKARESCISGDLGIDVYSQYVFHGLVLENQGAILQPYANIYFKLYEGDGFLNQASLNVGIWNSLHSNHPVVSSTRWWYEFDFLAGFAFTFAKNFSFSPTYVAYTSPGDYFATSHVLQLRLAYNDADLLGKFALNPYVMTEIELDGKAGNGTDEGAYYEVGLTPGATVGPITISIPLKVGFGSHDYYAGNAGYGFFSGGVALSCGIPMPECLGTWTASVNATYYHFGDAGDDANAVKNSDDHAFVFGGGIKVAF
jgi:hypothetical protein